MEEEVEGGRGRRKWKKEVEEGGGWRKRKWKRKWNSK